MEFYKKVDGEFILAGYEFTGFPANGIWWVKDGKRNLIEKLHDLTPPDNMILGYLTYQDDLATRMTEKVQAGGKISMHDIAAIACEFFGEKAAEKARADVFDF